MRNGSVKSTFHKCACIMPLFQTVFTLQLMDSGVSGKPGALAQPPVIQVLNIDIVTVNSTPAFQEVQTARDQMKNPFPVVSNSAQVRTSPFTS